MSSDGQSGTEDGVCVYIYISILRRVRKPEWGFRKPMLCMQQSTVVFFVLGVRDFKLV